MAKRKYYRQIDQKSPKKAFLFFLLKLALGAFLVFSPLSAALFFYYAKDLPLPEKFTERHLFQSTKIYDRTGEYLLYEIYGEEKRTWVPLETIPEQLKQAVVAAEDANFYHHFGLDPKGLARSLLINLKIKKATYGGSTIPQQLIRSTFFSLEKTAQRKIREMILAVELDRRYPKDKILEWYLNQVPFGSNAYGVEAASQTFFQKHASELTLEESATLTALINSPSYLSPFGSHKDELLARKNYVLNRMADCGYLTEIQAEEAKQKEIKFSEIVTPIKAPHFSLYVKDYLLSKYGEDFLKIKGLKVITSLDWNLQQWAEEAVSKNVKINETSNAFNAALVSIDPKTGEILAMVGSKDYFAKSYPSGCTEGVSCLFEPKVNIATYGEGRQPGSAFKPFAYSLLFKKGFTPETVFWDVKTEFNPNCPANATGTEKDAFGMDCYSPENYTGKFQGPVSLRNALAQSINVPAIKTLYIAGIKETIDLAKSFGITTLNKPLSWYGLSLVLGGGEVRLLDITSAYGVFATEGSRIPPVSILRIDDLEGNTIEKNNKQPEKILESQVARLISNVLSDNDARAPLFGLNSPLFFPGYDVAVKTGTTQDYRDAWTVGYTPFVVTGVWAGNNNNAAMQKRPGVILAGSIFHSYMEKVLQKYPIEKFNKPDPPQSENPIFRGVYDFSTSTPKTYHSVLYYINKNDPLGPPPQNPENDPQFNHWEEAIRLWLEKNIIP